MEIQYFGVTKLSHSRGWKAVAEGEYCGCFASPVDAARTVDDVLFMTHGAKSFWKLNLPEERPWLTECVCDGCGETKPFEDFKKPSGRRYRTVRCKTCERKRHYREPSEQAVHRTKSVRAFFGVLASKIKHRCNLKGIEYAIDADYLCGLYETQRGACALSGLAMPIVAGEGHHPLAPSVDRINPHGGYTPDNLQIVGFRLNQMKSNQSMADLIGLCQNVARFHPPVPS